MYVEGGGQSKDLRTRCREGFHQFLKLVATSRQPKIVACGSRRDAFDRFRMALSINPSGACLLLVDSEEAVTHGVDPWQHVAQREGDRWTRPERAADEHLHFMAVCMESWLVADPESLARFFGQDSQASAIPNNADLESLDRVTVFNALRAATRDTTKGEFTKGKLSFAALGAISVQAVRKRMSYCERFVSRLTSEAQVQVRKD
ncbi:MAG: hypothetical protein CHACPFDD_00499 [Phycisphaerae bacterium]|nr:hypothetical protein [Phycisphaerae bacterium]